MATPRESFQVSGHAGSFKKLSETESFSVACDYAMLQLQSEMAHNIQPGMPTDPYIGFDANAQMTGAARLVSILRTLSDPIKPPTTPKPDKLHYG